MNKKTKGAIAAGAAAALLAGGAGTFAAWSDSEALGGGSITAGTLTLDPVAGTSGWQMNDADLPAGKTISQILAVPGDTFTYTTQVKVGATGDNIAGVLTADTTTITGDATLKAQLNPTITATKNNTPLTVTGAGVAITGADNDAVIDVTVTFDFADAAATNASQGKSINLANFALKLDQTVS